MYRFFATLLFVALLSVAPSFGQTFTFEMHDTAIEYSDGFNYFTFHGVIDNLLDEERQLRLTLTQISVPDPLRGYSVCTWRGCYPPDSGTVEILETYSPLAHDTGAAVYIYNLSINPETGYMDTSTIHGNYTIRIRVENPNDTQEFVQYDLHLDQLGITPRLELVALSADLIRNYPNPFNPETTLQFDLARDANVTLKVFDVMGRDVATLVDRANLSAGVHSVPFDGSGLASGVYFARLSVEGLEMTRKMALLK